MKIKQLFSTPLYYAALVSSSLFMSSSLLDAEEKTMDQNKKALSQEYRFAPESSITFLGKKLTGSHKGGFRKFQGSFVLNKEQEPQSGSFTIEMSSAWSDHPKLTKHLKAEDFFHVSKYPRAYFEVTQFVKKDETSYQVTGKFTLRGVTKTLSFPAKVRLEKSAVWVRSSFVINRQEFEIRYPGMPDNLIKDKVQINLKLKAEQSAPVKRERVSLLSSF